jgi:excisionase family DNA binding protein
MLKFFTVREVAEMLAISRQHVLNLVRRGALPAINVGTKERPKFRIKASDLERGLEALRFDPAEKARSTLAPFYQPKKNYF